MQYCCELDEKCTIHFFAFHIRFCYRSRAHRVTVLVCESELRRECVSRKSSAADGSSRAGWRWRLHACMVIGLHHGGYFIPPWFPQSDHRPYYRSQILTCSGQSSVIRLNTWGELVISIYCSVLNQINSLASSSAPPPAAVAATADCLASSASVFKSSLH